MKIIMLLITFFALFTSCLTADKNVALKEVLDAKIKTELASGKKNDSILLGYYFGMTMEQAGAKTVELLANKTFRLDEDGNTVYVLGKNHGEDREAFFRTGYFKDSLYQIDLVVKDQTYDAPIYLVDLLTKKYGIPLEFNISTVNDYIRDYAWVDGNRMISIVARDSTYDILTLKYTDLYRKRKKTQYDLAIEKQKAATDSINDINTEEKVKNQL